MSFVHHPASVTNAVLSILANFNKPLTGFEKLSLGFSELNEKLSDTIVDRFTSHCRNLKKLHFFCDFSRESDRLNYCELVVKLFDAQTHNNMQSLGVRGFSVTEQGATH